jgi:hypothetical protein
VFVFASQGFLVVAGLLSELGFPESSDSFLLASSFGLLVAFSLATKHHRFSKAAKQTPVFSQTNASTTKRSPGLLFDLWVS